MSAPAPRVLIARSDGDYARLVPEIFAATGAEDLIAPGQSVLIKPNLHAPQHWTTGGTVNPALVVALIEWARARGAGRILVADGPYAGMARPEDVFTETGMAQAVEAAGAEWAALPRLPYRTFTEASPHLPTRTDISELAFAFDRLLNVAVLKTHIDCLVTLGMKNLKGLLSTDSKWAFHRDVDLDRALVELNRLVQADFTLVDGTVGMEGMGPAAGVAANFGCLFAGRHAPSVDLIAAAAVGCALEEVRTLRYAREVGMLDPDSVETVGEDLAQVSRRFERPYEAMLRRLPGLRWEGEKACSACKLNLIRALCENASAGVTVPDRCLIIGEALVSDPEAILVGRCAGRGRGDQPFLPGCPPRVDKLKEFLAGVVPPPEPE